MDELEASTLHVLAEQAREKKWDYEGATGVLGGRRLSDYVSTFRWYRYEVGMARWARLH